MKKPKIAVICAAVVCIISVIVMASALIFTQNQTPAFTPPDFDNTAQVGSPSVPEEMDYTPVEVEDGYVFSVCGKPVEDNGRLLLYFTSADENTVWLRLRVYDDAGNLLGESGVIRPGEYIPSLEIEEDAGIGDAVKLKIMAYTPETWHSAGAVEMNTQIYSGSDSTEKENQT